MGQVRRCISDTDQTVVLGDLELHSEPDLPNRALVRKVKCPVHASTQADRDTIDKFGPTH